ncbi:MAG: HPr family phosphocarrier protein [Candidatus Sumerlaea chitinivorans]|nr:HPr family phosphocarrier protein [Candidatus Sumerlaea chitinivorans]
MRETATDEAMSTTARREVTILNNAGLHLRPAAAFVQAANKFKNTDVYVISDEKRVNGKSIMGLVMLAAGKGTKLTIECVGDQSEEAADTLAQLIENHFGMDT